MTDSERFPFLKELIELDKRLHKNWEEYDHYVISSPLANAKPKAAKKSAKQATEKPKKSAISTKKSK